MIKTQKNQKKDLEQKLQLAHKNLTDAQAKTTELTNQQADFDEKNKQACQKREPQDAHRALGVFKERGHGWGKCRRCLLERPAKVLWQTQNYPAFTKPEPGLLELVHRVDPARTSKEHRIEITVPVAIEFLQAK